MEIAGITIRNFKGTLRRCAIGYMRTGRYRRGEDPRYMRKAAGIVMVEGVGEGKGRAPEMGSGTGRFQAWQVLLGVSSGKRKAAYDAVRFVWQRNK